MRTQSSIPCADLVASDEPTAAAGLSDPGMQDRALEFETTAPSGIPSTRAGRIWVRILPALAVVGIGVAFILQNLHHAQVSLLTVSGSVPVAVALLVSFALGAASVLLLGSIRILQLRKVIRLGASAGAR